MMTLAKRLGFWGILLSGFLSTQVFAEPVSIATIEGSPQNEASLRCYHLDVEADSRNDARVQSIVPSPDYAVIVTLRRTTEYQLSNARAVDTQALRTNTSLHQIFCQEQQRQIPEDRARDVLTERLRQGLRHADLGTSPIVVTATRPFSAMVIQTLNVVIRDGQCHYQSESLGFLSRVSPDVRQQFCRRLRATQLQAGLDRCLTRVNEVLSLRLQDPDGAVPEGVPTVRFCRTLVENFDGTNGGQSSLFTALSEIYSCGSAQSRFQVLQRVSTTRFGLRLLEEEIARYFGQGYVGDAAHSTEPGSFGGHIYSAIVGLRCDLRVLNENNCDRQAEEWGVPFVQGSCKPCDYTWDQEYNEINGGRFDLDPNYRRNVCRGVSAWRRNYYTSCSSFAHQSRSYRFFPAVERAPRAIYNARYVACRCERTDLTHHVQPSEVELSDISPIRYGGGIPRGESCGNYRGPYDGLENFDFFGPAR